jgi:hypothetical protein
MNNDNFLNILKDKRIIFAIVVFALIVISILIYSNIQSRINPYDEYIKINNLSREIRNLPNNVIFDIENELFKVVSFNNESVDHKNISADIRQGSIVTRHDTEFDINSGNFIVDIPLLKQSYGIHFEWSRTTGNTGLSGYPILAYCLPESDLIFGHFPCIDVSTEEDLSHIDDRILSFLPFANTSFSIRSNGVIDNSKYNLQIQLNIEAMFISVDGTPDPTIFNNLKQKVANWFTERSLDINNYNITYAY